jgi:hypothetical protein
MLFEDFIFDTTPMYANNEIIEEETVDESFEYPLLTPPISMPSSPECEKKNLHLLNDSDMREIKFLQRMQKDAQKSASKPDITDKFEIQLQVKKTIENIDAKSNLKMKLNSISPMDQAILKRCTSKKLSKQYNSSKELFRIQQQDSEINSELEANTFDFIEVW